MALLIHYTATDDNTRPVEYIVIIDDDEARPGEGDDENLREGYQLSGFVEIIGSVTQFPCDRPLWPRQFSDCGIE